MPGYFLLYKLITVYHKYPDITTTKKICPLLLSVGTVHIDLNDMEGLMKCLDMFSPEDINLILRKITEVRQSKDLLRLARFSLYFLISWAA